MGFANERRGLEIANSNYKYLTEGAYGLVFVNRDKGRILKVYKSSHPKTHSAEVFKAETEAYETSMAASELKELVPEFFGTRNNIIIKDKEGKDVTSEVYADLAFEAEFVDGRFNKISVAPESERNRVRQLFWNHGIKHTIDASILVENDKIKKVIDFSTIEIVPQAESF